MQNVWVEVCGVLDESLFSDDCVFTSVFGWLICASEGGGGRGVRGGSVTSKAAFYLPVIIITDNLSILRLGGVSQELFVLFLQLTRRHHTAAFEACCLI